MHCAGCTPLHVAEGAGHIDVADALRRAGARDDVTNAHGLTPAQFRQYFVPGSSTGEKVAAAASIGQMHASMNIAGILKMDIEKGMELEIFRKAQAMDKDESVRRREGGTPAGLAGPGRGYRPGPGKALKTQKPSMMRCAQLPAAHATAAKESKEAGVGVGL